MMQNDDIGYEICVYSIKIIIILNLFHFAKHLCLMKVHKLVREIKYRISNRNRSITLYPRHLIYLETHQHITLLNVPKGKKSLKKYLQGVISPECARSIS